MEPAIAVLRYEIDVGGRDEAHDHADHQLVWSPTHVLTVDIGDRCWILPPSLALFVPAGVVHATSAPRRSSMAGIHLRPDRCPIPWTSPTVIAVVPLLRDLLLFLEAGDGTLAARTRDHAEALVYELFHPVSVTTLHVPLPTDARAREVAVAIVADPADDRPLERWAADVGASVRTLSRRFAAETGMSFVRWRAHARMRAALHLLAEGTPIKAVGRAVGYSTPSAFVAVFRRVTGQTPASYFDPHPQ